MKRTVIEGNHVTTYDKSLGIIHTYEIVDRVPRGYFIWNIGNHAPDGFVPLCEWLEPGMTVNPDTLKAIAHEHAAEITGMASASATTPLKAIDFLARYRSGKEDDRWAYERVMAGYDYLMELPWER